MTKKRRTATPHPEWVLMYRKGLSRKKIAELTRNDVATVSHYISVAKTADPALHAEHAAAAKGSAARAVPGLKRMHQVVAMVEATGRYPSRNAEDRAERELAQWLRRRRRDAEAGILNPVIREGLAALPDWQRKPREAAGQQKWQDRFRELVAYRAAGHPWPRATPTVTGKEHELGVWLRGQRYKYKHGQLQPARAQALDTALPGWITGRKAAPTLPQ
ncbi:helicase associated domain-containing protein [Arthrobacter sp. ISL-5]|uniref:helicase associated domain-containing protein n=1 Tax=Arthrobacter sp. ISL-5 TaxID=2819111 RepID=UPI001BE50AE4|nr:helicase associated domain-containing protein [Arthrobacter sp. ISL-5]MBT2552702.1 helicase associated domain-containing protein [Arthrobacter sp. ISL-5]